MPTLDSVLAGIPGYGGFAAKRQMNEREDDTEIQRAGALLALRTKLEAQQREQQFRSGLRPDMTQDELAKHAAQFAGAEKVLDVQQKSLDRQEAGKQRAQAAADNLSIRQQQLDVLRDRIAQSTADAAAKRQFDEWYKGESLKVQQQLADLRRETASNQPVTTATIVDPTNPKQMLVVDARTYRGGGAGSPGVIGIGGKESDAQKRENTAAFGMRGLGGAIQEAEDILSGVRRDAQGNVTQGTLPTQSGIGSAADAVAGWFGTTLPGGPEADRLKVVGGVLTSKVPRMEGPQSNLDVDLYKQMAGQAGNEKLPVQRRLAAVREMKRLYAKYEHLQGEAAPSAVPGGGGGGFQEGQTATGPGGQKIIFERGQWRPVTSR